MIHRAKFQNFKALRDVEVTFDSRLTVLVGPNGSGKTSVLQGIHYLTQLARENNAEPEHQLQGLPEYRSLGSGPWDAFHLQLEGARFGEGEPYHLVLDGVEKGGVQFVVQVPEKETPSQLLATAFWSETGIKDITQVRRPLPALSRVRFDRSALIGFSVRQLAEATLISSYPPEVTTDGYGLAATLSYIKAKYPARFDAIIEAFRRVIPSVRGVRFDKERVPQLEFYGDVLLVDYKGAEGVKASHVSSGTLFALGLLTVTLGPDSANVILLDDLDHGLHPKAQMELIAVFRSLIEQNPDLQIVATSHSPYILDKLAWNEVRVTALNDDGSAVCAPLTDHPLYEQWKDSMSPGEFWSHGGEDWVKELPPQTSTP